MRFCVFEDRAENFDPLTLTRPVFDLVCGITSLIDKQLRAFGMSEYGMIVRSLLDGMCRHAHPNVPVNDSTWLAAAPTIVVNGRWLPPATPLSSAPESPPRALSRASASGGPSVASSRCPA